VHNSDVPSNIHQDAKGTVEGDMLEGGQRTLPTHSARYTVLKSDTPNHDDNATRTWRLTAQQSLASIMTTLHPQVTASQTKTLSHHSPLRREWH